MVEDVKFHDLIRWRVNKSHHKKIDVVVDNIECGGNRKEKRVFDSRPQWTDFRGLGSRSRITVEENSRYESLTKFAKKVSSKNRWAYFAELNTQINSKGDVLFIG